MSSDERIIRRASRLSKQEARDVLLCSAANVAEEMGGLLLREEVEEMGLFEARRRIAEEFPGIESYVVMRGLEDLTGREFGLKYEPNPSQTVVPATLQAA